LAKNHISHIVVVGATTFAPPPAIGTTQVLTQSSGAPAAVAIAQFATDALGWSPHAVVLARGDAFGDAIAAAEVAASDHGVLLLAAAPTTLGAATTEFLQTHPALTRLEVVGDPTAVGAGIAEAAAAAGRCCT
jgi:hypothetical protein